ncbi:MAG: hypothetical protein FJ125_08465 [Deltaproteobacteria bacterium]|nr:hypothetical protein [Deltaproteobacteria bacterium]
MSGTSSSSAAERRLLPLLLGALLAAGAAGCSAEELFIDGATLDRCDGSWPICQTVAGCRLEADEYLEGRFPGGRRFIVRTAGPARIVLVLLFDDQRSTGTDTEVFWYEPGCFERYTFSSEGRDVFRAAGETGLYEVARRVHEGGDHLIELHSDAFCSYLLKARVEQQD